MGGLANISADVKTACILNTYTLGEAHATMAPGYETKDRKTGGRMITKQSRGVRKLARNHG